MTAPSLAQLPTNTINIRAGSNDTGITITDSEIQLRIDGLPIIEAKKDGRLLVRGVDVDDDSTIYPALKQWLRSTLAPTPPARALRLVPDPAP